MKKAEQVRQESKIARIRREIEIILHSPLREEEWEDLVEEGYIEEHLEYGSPTTSEIAEKVKRRRQVYGKREPKRGNAPRMLSEQEVKESSGRLKALSLLVAQEAAKEVSVQRFRSEVLGDKLLSLESVEGWIQEEAKLDGPHTWWLSGVPLPREYPMDVLMEAFLQHGIFEREERPLGLELQASPRPEDFTFHFLAYGVPGSEEKKEIPVSVNGLLERLRTLSIPLAEEYGWNEAEATLFILTGAVPEIKAVTSTFQSRRISALSRIVLTLDPALSPKEVAEQYRRIRQEVIPGRHRDLSEKHMQLALFAANRSEGQTWVDKMAEWNKTHAAEWKYEEVANFAHDCLQARRRLLRSESEGGKDSPDEASEENQLPELEYIEKREEASWQNAGDMAKAPSTSARMEGGLARSQLTETSERHFTLRLEKKSKSD
jgi:hypothetical protein